MTEMRGMKIGRWVAVLAAIALMPLAASAQEGLAGLSRAIGIAERSLGARAIEGRLETRDDVLVYEISLARAGAFHKAFIDAKTAQLIAVQEPRLEGFYRRWMDNARLWAAQRALAPMLVTLEEHAQGRVHKVAMRMKKDRPIYEVQIETVHGVAEIELDATTGKRLSHSSD